MTCVETNTPIHRKLKENVKQGTVSCIMINKYIGYVIGGGLEGLGIEAQWRRDFLYPSILVLGPIQPPKQ